MPHTFSQRKDETKALLPVQIAVLTVSDSRTLANDTSGARLEEMILEAGHKVVLRKVLPDETKVLVPVLRELVDDKSVDCVITSGGTGITGRDVTPEAFRMVLDREIEGFGELFRWLSYQKIGVSTMQSRALGGVAGGTFLFAVPGSTSACEDAWMDILRHQLDSRTRPCNLVELMPRLMEV